MAQRSSGSLSVKEWEPWLRYDFEWAKEFLCEFRSRTSSPDMLGTKERLCPLL